MKYRKLKLEELGRKSVSEFHKAEKMPIAFVLDNVRSALNVGSVFRTADALGLNEILLCGISARPPHREINKTAIGSTVSVSWKYFSKPLDVLKYLRDRKYEIVGVEQTDKSIPLHDWKPDFLRKKALIFGNEVDGISDEFLSHLDLALEIPQFGTKHSFNIAVSAGIVGWHAVLKGKLT
ncbi:MAG: TrmH family RNA methyltransferase [Bacteroidetes bacterium]|jgi:tRNA G18 (ribose-2'-O)-methylase SpoU|nr:TrmH family RNA methyltransferase [Bacteroidota bacterium]